MSDCEICRNHQECKLEEKDKVSRCGFVYPTELELAKKTKEYALGYQQGRADAIESELQKYTEEYTKQIRADVIEEVDRFIKSFPSIQFHTTVLEEWERFKDKLKEQK